MGFAFENEANTIIPGGPQDTPDSGALPFAFEQRPQPVTEAVAEAVKQSPDEAAKTQRLSRESGLSSSDVATNPQAVEADLRVNAIDQATSDTPVTRQWMTDLENAAVAHDDVENLSAVERAARAWRAGIAGVELGRAGTAWRNAPNDPSLQARVEALTAEIAGLETGESDSAIMNYLAPAIKVLGQQVETLDSSKLLPRIGAGTLVGAAAGVSSAPLTAGISVPVGLAAGAASGLISHVAIETYVNEGGNSYVEMRKAGIDPQAAGYLSHGVGVINAALEIGGAAAVFKPFGDAAKTLIRARIRENLSKEGALTLARQFGANYMIGIAGETGTEMSQEVVSIAAEEIGKQFTSEELKSITPEEFADRVSAVALETMQAMSVLALPGPAAHTTTQLAASRKAVKNKDAMDAMVEQAQASKLAQRAPERLGDHLEKVMEDVGAEEMYVPGDKLVEWLDKQPDPQGLAVALGVADDLQEATALGQDLTISGDKFARYIMANPAYESLSDHIRHEQDGMTAFEAKEYADSGIQDEVAAVAARVGVEIEQTDESVDIAEHEMGMKQLFMTADEAGMTPSQYTGYLANIEKAKTAAAIEQEDKVLRQQQRELTKQWQAELELEREQAREDMITEPHYQAFTGVGAARLDQAQVAAAADELGIKLENLPTQQGRRIYTTQKGEPSVDLSTHAELYGFDSPLEMIWAFNYHPPLDEAVEQRAHSRMLERHGDLMDQRSAVIEARASLHTDAQGSVLADELSALRTATNQKRVSIRQLSRAAKNKLRSMKVSQVQPSKIMAAERRLAHAASKAVKKGDLSLAADLKFQQALNFYMAKHAISQTKRIEQMRGYMDKFENKKIKHPSVPSKYLEAIHELLDKVSFKPKASPARLNMLIEVANSKRDPTSLEAKYLDHASRLNWRDMDFGDLEGLYNNVRAIEHKGKTENRLRRQHEKHEIELIGTFITDEMDKNLKPDAKAHEENRGRIAKFKQFGKHAATLALNMESIIREMDGFKDNGVVFQNTIGRIHQAMAQGYQEGQVGYLRRQRAESQKLRELFDVFTPKERKTMNDKLRIEGVGRDISHHTVLAVLLNSGNEGNIAAMLDSKTFSEQEIQAIHNYASKKDWDFAQSVWDYLETFWPEVRDAEARRSNHVVEKVESKEIDTPHGQYKGGYYPIRFDKQKSVFDISNEKAVDEMIDKTRMGTVVSSHTARGHTLERAGTSEGARVSLDLFALASHVDQVIYDLEVGDAITDFYKVWYSKPVKQKFVDMGLNHYWDHGDLYTRDVITQEITNNSAWEQAFRWLRTGFTVSKLAWNVGVAALQPLGLIQSSVQMGHSHMMRGIRTYWAMPKTGAKSVYKFVESQSGFMESRGETWNKDVLDAKKLLSKTFVPEMIIDSYFWAIKVAQRTTDVITWIGAYDKGMKQFANDHNQAVTLADRTVARAQASGIFSDRTPAERGTVHKNIRQTEGVRAFTALISYFAAKYNVAWERTKKTSFRNPGEVIKWATDITLLYTIEALVAGMVTGQIPNEDDEETVASWLAKETLKTFAAGLVGIREVASVLSGFPGGGTIGSLLSDVKRAGDQVSQGEFDAALLKSINNLGGTVFHYPSSQPNKIITNVDNLMNGDDVTVQEWLMGPHYKR